MIDEVLDEWGEDLAGATESPGPRVPLMFAGATTLVALLVALWVLRGDLRFDLLGAPPAASLVELQAVRHQARMLRHQGRLAEAWRRLREAYVLQPGHPQLAMDLAELHLARCRAASGRLDEGQRLRLEFADEYARLARARLPSPVRADMVALEVSVLRAEDLGLEVSRLHQDAGAALARLPEARRFLARGKDLAWRLEEVVHDEDERDHLRELSARLALESARSQVREVRALLLRRGEQDLASARVLCDQLGRAQDLPEAVAKMARARCASLGGAP